MTHTRSKRGSAYTQSIYGRHAYTQKIKGNTMTRKVIPFMVELCSHPSVLTDSMHDKQRLCAFQHLNAITDIIWNGADHLHVDTVAKFRMHLDAFLASWTWLGGQCELRKEVNYNMTPKFHVLYHIGEEAYYNNPRTHSTYQDEDYVGLISDAMLACLCGISLSKVSEKLVHKYLRGLSIRWKSQRVHDSYS